MSEPDVRLFDALRVEIHPDAAALAASAADAAVGAVQAAISDRGTANVMFASGTSQLRFLDLLTKRSDVEWAKIVGFHMDEYLGIRSDHPASFARYMRERIAERVPIAAFHLLHGDAADPEVEAARYAALLTDHPLDVCCLGIGENGHLAFNDPPADFDDPRAVRVVTLDPACRSQQVGEGHFAEEGAVPERALTVTLPALLGARTVLAVVSERRKAEPVRRALEEPVTPSCPASALRRCAHATLYLDLASAASLGRASR